MTMPYISDEYSLRKALRKTVALLGVCIALTLMLSSCGDTTDTNNENQELERDHSAKAVLDYESGIITTPISAYSVPSRVLAKAKRAKVLMILPCLKKKGFTQTPPAVPQDSTPMSNDGSLWGIWSVKLAQKHGFELDDGSELIEFKRIHSIPGFTEAQDECHSEQSSEIKKLYQDDPFSTSEIESTIAGTAYGAVQQSEEYKSIHSQFQDCVRTHGYVPDEGWTTSDVVASDTGKPTAKEIKAATAVAQCATDLQSAQRLSDMKASFEAPLIKKHQAQLEARLKTIRDMEARLDEKLKGLE